jgi:hypothetical protein
MNPSFLRWFCNTLLYDICTEGIHSIENMTKILAGWWVKISDLMIFWSQTSETYSRNCWSLTEDIAVMIDPMNLTSWLITSKKTF